MPWNGRAQVCHRRPFEPFRAQIGKRVMSDLSGPIFTFEGLKLPVVGEGSIQY